MLKEQNDLNGSLAPLIGLRARFFSRIPPFFQSFSMGHKKTKVKDIMEESERPKKRKRTDDEFIDEKTDSVKVFSVHRRRNRQLKFRAIPGTAPVQLEPGTSDPVDEIAITAIYDEDFGELEMYNTKSKARGTLHVRSFRNYTHAPPYARCLPPDQITGVETV